MIAFQFQFLSGNASQNGISAIDLLVLSFNSFQVMHHYVEYDEDVDIESFNSFQVMHHENNSRCEGKRDSNVSIPFR